ncbi:LysR family transcriptional regulator [Pseudooceanicola lipolyticus]|uniref:LysR family transcriptional regulator n=1 Tax=Pseudooceanicola lipolyticus TaxID=2029104 RepID=A0A2M8IX90_9RHOB|nr:LysR family transcriptional regulator [Pseudooceanicola lipolyticus]PJE35147.1 LysR family transcriptional regulator [Pseudooceanicola lipolyticus]
MNNWDEVRTAYQVARMGTVSGAAEVLGVHHATVIRHIDALEARLGVKLFQRHPRGYTPTEAGQDLLRVAQTTDDQFNQLVARLKGQGEDVTGELVVTSLAEHAPVVVPALADFQTGHPGLIVRYLTGARLFRLEYGEAHVALRAGAAPNQPDNVVQRFARQAVALYGSKAYAERMGLPQSEAELEQHWFIGMDEANSRAPFAQWLNQHVPRERVSFRGMDGFALREAVLAGAGLGFMSVCEARRSPDLVQVLEPRDEWSAPVWLVTHVDLHRTPKVQSFLKFLKSRAGDWS